MSVENIEEIELVSLDLPLVFRLSLVYEDLCNMYENICKFYNRRMISKRLARGWKEIHEDILDAPVCEEQQRIVNVWTFSNLYDIGAESNGVCSICGENGVIISFYHATKNLFVFGKRMIKYSFARRAKSEFKYIEMV